MDILLRVEVSSDGSTVHDVVATVEPSHPVDAVVEALTRYFGLPADPGWAVTRGRSNDVLESTDLLSEVGLVSGELLRLRRAIPTIAGKADKPPLPRVPPRPDAPPPPTGRSASSRPAPAPLIGRSASSRPAPPPLTGRSASIRPAPPPPTGRSPSTPIAGSGAQLNLVVCSGPDAGLVQALVPGTLSIGRDHACGLVLSDPQVARSHLLVRWDGGTDLALVLDPSPTDPSPLAAIDGEPISGEVSLAVGQLIRVGASTLAVRTSGSRPSASGIDVGEVAFHRTPYYPAPVEATVFEPLGDAPDKAEPTPFAYLAALAPLVLGIGLAVLYSPRFLIFAAFSPVVAVAGYIDQRRRVRRRYGRSEVRFRQQLVERRDEVRRAIAGERARRFLGGQDIVALAQRAHNRSVELWIRDRRAADFLTLRLGLGTVDPMVAVRPETRGSEALRDEANSGLGAVTSMRDVPITVSLLDVAVAAIVGDDREVTPMATSLIVQACCLHSPEDLVVAALVAEHRGMDAWLPWLPHARSTSSPVPGPHVATDRSGADQLLKELLVVAEQRLAAGDRPPGNRWPRLLIVVDRGLEPEPSLLSRLLDLGPSAGIAVLWMTAGEDRVPRQAGAVVSCRSLLSSTSSVVSFTDPDLDDQPLEIERLGALAATDIACALAPLRDASSANSSSALPRTVSLQEALGEVDFDADWVLDQWRIDRGDRLPGTIGRSVNGPLQVDLVAHGPHVLIGGTSGAGKSELLMSMVAGLMALNPPDRLNVLFIDYKGGASTEVFRHAPHTVGCVTNLDAVLARRALTSLRAELNRRMDLLHGRAKDLGELLALDPEAAPPSLAIVIDEFATLVNEVPEFMVGVVDIAQRGRSLGIHLILATQRPSGAINENILANTNLRISLRMLDSAESLSVIGSPEAALIPTPLKGRGFARLGPGQLVPFQTAWSGAPSIASSGPPPVTVAPLHPSGTASLPMPGHLVAADPVASHLVAADPVASHLVAADPVASHLVAADPVASHLDAAIVASHPVLSELVASERAARTQLDVLLASIHAAACRLRVRPARSPWLDELPDHVPLAEVHGGDRALPGAGGPGLVVPIAIVDDPAAQDQYPGLIDFDADGGLLIFGTGGSGKTTALRTLALSAALDDNARGGGTLTIFGLDFASRQLAALAALPQCAAVATGDDLEAVTRIVVVLEEELERRLGAVAGAARSGDDAGSFDRILLLIDDYGGLVQRFEGAAASAGLYPWLERINRLIVDGRQVGLYTAAATTRPAAVRGGVRAAISKRIVLRQADAAAYAELELPAALVGDLDLPPGRGFFNGANQCQVALPGGLQGTAESDDHEYGDCASASAQQQVIRRIALTLNGSIRPGLSTEPLPQDAPPERPTGRRLTAVLGLADLSLAPVEIDLSASNFAVVGEPRSGRSTALMAVADHLSANGTEVWLAGPLGSPLADATMAARTAIGRPGVVLPLLEDLAAVLDADGPILIIDDVDLLDDPVLESILGTLLNDGLRFAASTGGFRGYSTSPLVQAMKKARSILVLRPDGSAEIQDATGVAVGLRPGLGMVPGRGVLVANRLSTVVQLPKYF